MTTLNKIWFIALWISASLIHAAQAAPPEGAREPQSMVFYFANNSSLLMREYRTNAAELGKLDGILQNPDIASAVDSIVIHGNSSIPGSVQVNARLSNQRALAVKGYIRWKHPQIDDSKIDIRWSAFNWTVLKDMVENDPQTPYRNQIIKILSSSLDDEAKSNRLQGLGNGVVKGYIINNFSRFMRSATSVVFYMNDTATIAFVPTEERTLENVENAGNGENVAQTTDTTEITVISFVPPLITPERKPLFAVKTNLLFDAVSALNVEVEVPLDRRWSLAAEWVFPWWLWEKKQYALEVLSGSVELRRWFGDRYREELMTGWFAGVYAGGGYYDVEWKTKGFQGEFFTVGLTGGYAHKICRDWRMEYSLGLGYLGSKYREYAPEKGSDDRWHLIRRGDGNFNWIGPTKAKVSLVWMINKGYRR